ncbi:uncharacterized protein LOC117120390 [Anneissia japonica]|uniref:uncharacterized protein LOC117120390 n=1 Tax=Anneissia japonica TaxID=1529436 RepID=UPI0014259389|nr:uncharacterized protein LOC117120390 [Anneissia japonica]
MDDCSRSMETAEKALHLIQDLKAVCQKGGFNLTKWIYNDKAVLAQIPKEDRAKGIKDLDLENSQLPTERALGLRWDVKRDSFGFKVGKFKTEAKRRSILSAVSTNYDPLGFIAPVTVSAKNVLQDLCRLKLD